MISILYNIKKCPYCNKRIRAGVCRNHKPVVLDFYSYVDNDTINDVFQIMYFNEIPRFNKDLRDVMIYSVQFELPDRKIYCGDYSNKRIISVMSEMKIDYFDPFKIPLDEVLQTLAIYKLFS
jgi:hypothetical protein